MNHAHDQGPENSVKQVLMKHSDLLAAEFHGCHIDDGWADLLDKILEEWRKSSAPSIVKIKSKFGSMRITAVDQSHPKARRLRTEAMRRSESICEICGALGKPVAHAGTRSCLCEEHASDWRP